MPDAIINYRQDNESSSVNNRGEVFYVCEEYAEIERWLSELDEGDRARLLFPVEQTAKYDSYMWNYVRLAPEFRARFPAVHAEGIPGGARCRPGGAFRLPALETREPETHSGIARKIRA